MSIQYIILFGRRYNEETKGGHLLDATVRSGGLDCVLHTASLQVFVSAQTPTIRASNNALVIGRLFNKHGEPINKLPDLTSPDAVIKNLLEEFWGEYVVIIPDKSDDKSLTVFRDPSGAVGCIYSIKKRGGFITSSIDLATKTGLYQKEIDWHGIAHSLAFPYLRVERTALKSIRELTPGNSLTKNGREISTQPRWSPWQFVASKVRHTDARLAAAELRSTILLTTSALAQSDETFIVELSGGLDSSIVAASLHSRSSSAILCTLVMPTPDSHEISYAKMVSNHLDSDLVLVDVKWGDIAFEFTAGPNSVTPDIGILQRAVNSAWEAAGSLHDVDSFFSGGGGDTVFCYLKTAAPAADAFRERGLGAAISAIRDLSNLHQCTVWKAVELAIKKVWRVPNTSWNRDDRFLIPGLAPHTPDPHPWLNTPANALPGDIERIRDLVGTGIFRDATPRSDGRSMRYPLLSQPVMEACLKTPTWMWITGGRNRAIAREAFDNLLPNTVLHRLSKGSYTSYMATVYDRNKAGMREFLMDGCLSSNGLIDKSALSTFLTAELAPRDFSFLRIFDLCAAENWIRSQPNQAR